MNKLNKFTAEIFLILLKIPPIPIGSMKGRPSYNRSLHPSKENIQHFKT
jgi:hypothetical protein